MQLHYQQYGNGHPLIILHGLFGMSDNWVTHARRLADDFAVYALDQRNHGKSGWHDVFNYEAMADDLLEFIDHHDLQNVFLLGHSMGGKTAMQFSLEHPDKVGKLIIADMSPDAYNHKHDVLIDAMLSVNLEKFNSRSEVEGELEKSVPDARIRQFLLKNLYWKDRISLGWKANLEVILENLPEVFKAIQSKNSFAKPTLFLKGAESPYIQNKHLSQIKELFPKSEVTTIEGASHWLHAERPEEFYNLTRNFLQNT
jgi:esterase